MCVWHDLLMYRLCDKEQRVMSHAVWTSCLQEYMLQHVAVCCSMLQCATECVRQMYPITYMYESCHTCKWICTHHTCKQICTCDKWICTCDLHVYSDSRKCFFFCTMKLHIKICTINLHVWPDSYMYVAFIHTVCHAVYTAYLYILPIYIYCLFITHYTLEVVQENFFLKPRP